MSRKTASAAMALMLAADFAPAQVGQAIRLPPVNYDNSPRVHELIRAGNLYLSLQDALALAIENNLDIELQRYLLPIGDLELQRTRGGGVTRGLNFTVFEVPTGTGGPLSPLPTAGAAAGRATTGSSIGTSTLTLNALGGPQTNLAIQGTIPQSTGVAVPNFDPALVGQLNWTHQTTPQTNTVTTGAPALITNSTLFNAGVQQGFATGGFAGLSF